MKNWGDFMSKKLLLAGEPMGLFIAQNVGKLEDVDGYSVAVAGAEFNVAVGIKRLGQDVSYMTKLGDDPFGKRIVKVMNQNGISTDTISYSKERSTGFMLKSTVETGDPEIFYFRKNSAASTFCIKDIENVNFDDFDFIHLTGIFPALSNETRQACDYIISEAKKRNIFVSFDPNLRPQLWESQEMMIEYINKMASQCDLFLPGVSEAKLLIGEEVPERIAEKYMQMGAKSVVLKLGTKGAFYKTKDEECYVEGFKVEKVVDTVGAGDGFAVGVISALREGMSMHDAVRRGTAIGAIQVMSKGDNDGLPNRDELSKYMDGNKNWREK